MPHESFELDIKVWQALKRANLKSLISAYPKKLEAPVEQDGANFSVGQRQLLSMSRALLRRSKILVLDEATSSLDSQTELQIQEAMQPLMRGRTTVAIAHRLSTVLAADKIIVLDEGKLIEAGTHSELISKNGLYATLYEIQFKPQLSGALHTSI